VLMRIDDAGVATRPQAAVDTTEGRPVAGVCDFRLGTGAMFRRIGLGDRAWTQIC
jgi:hypothetical protein